MAKFNTKGARPAIGTGPVTTTGETLNHAGAPGFTHDMYGELFLLAASNLVGEDTFYESGSARDTRFRGLARATAVADGPWIAGLIKWLRSEANLRSAPIMLACEAVHARLAAGLGGLNRGIISSACARADEPGELLAYWQTRFGRALPMPVKRGLADAATRLYNEYSMLKYDTFRHAIRFADVLALCHPRGARAGKDLLFTHALDRRLGHAAHDIDDLPMVAAHWRLRELADAYGPETLLDTERLREAGMTWEDVKSMAGGAVDAAKLWTALIPVMGVTALARNLRAFDEAGVADDMAEQVCARFSDPGQVAKSRMLPFQWLSAYRHAPSLRWGHALDKAIQASVKNIPALPGRTLVLVDTSSSMTTKRLSAHSTVTPLMAGAVFGTALAVKGEHVDLHGFANATFLHKVPKGGSLIAESERLAARVGEVGHGTQIASALHTTYQGHDRVVVISDMQTMDRGVTTAIPARIPMFGFNLGGYAASAIDTREPNRVELGGLSDGTFRLLPLIEAGIKAAWPFTPVAGDQ